MRCRESASRTSIPGTTDGGERLPPGAFAGIV
jgi:hypothetical protein